MLYGTTALKFSKYPPKNINKFVNLYLKPSLKNKGLKSKSWNFLTVFSTIAKHFYPTASDQTQHIRIFEILKTRIFEPLTIF